MKELKTLSTTVYLDLEWNFSDILCPASNVPELIEIGIVELDQSHLAREANYLVRPRNVDISLRCTSFTGITRKDLVRVRRCAT